MPDRAVTCPGCGRPLEIPDIKALALALLRPRPAWPGRPVLVSNEEKAVLCGQDKGDTMPDRIEQDPEIVTGVTVPGWVLGLLVALGAAKLAGLVLNLGLWALRG